MIWNIIDRRNRQHRWERVNAIIEAVEHDNSCVDADQAPDQDVQTIIDYAQREDVSLREAVDWAQAAACNVTLYLYDLGAGTTVPEQSQSNGTAHFDAVADRFGDA